MATGMKLGAFTIKKARKGGLLGASAASNGSAGAAAAALRGFETAKPVDATEHRVYVTDFDPSAVAALDGDGKPKKTLVIELIKTNQWKKEDSDSGAGSAAAAATTSDGAADEGASTAPVAASEPVVPASDLTEDERAANELLAEAQRLQQGGGSSGGMRDTTLVIPMASAQDGDALAAKRMQLFNLNAAPANATAEKAVPILQQNAVPGLDELADVTEKYRHDVALRPEAQDVTSEVYDNVPVEEFGAAMLRGMGWKGSVDDDKDGDGMGPKPRHKLLGLGATARPGAAGDANRPGRGGRRRDDQPLEAEARAAPDEIGIAIATATDAMTAAVDSPRSVAVAEAAAAIAIAIAVANETTAVTIDDAAAEAVIDLPRSEDVGDELVNGTHTQTPDREQ
ncbi:hypothetical protein P43SY_007981 [Pythium insidiosum]|uniref:Spp2/MOS2 G-patch domain-containing protein n=1 Tax=Pythium insidiosum TaxID=114742 RepID=A0AAD5Q4K4_PYTIN|nr:hypothetical protein P43SY_007981 [Pythium insidiosum]